MLFGLISTAHAAEDAISIKLAPYVLGEVAGVPITPTMLTVWLSMLLLTIVAVVVGRKTRLSPSPTQNVFEMIIGGAYDYEESTLESKQLAQKYFPILMTMFLFLLVMNWVGLLPGVTSIGFWEGHGHEEHLVPLLYPPATDLNIAIGFAFVAMIVIEFAGIAALGFFHYGSKFINFSSPVFAL